MIPVALASATAAAARRYILGLGPLFPVPAASRSSSDRKGSPAASSPACSPAACRRCSRSPSTRPRTPSAKLPIHWMWWPAIGGLVIGLGGLVFPQALGVGYDTIGSLLQGDVPGADHSRRPDREVDHLVGLARLGHLGRRARAAADDGRRARRRRGDGPSRPKAPGSGRSSAWARSSAGRCDRRSRASCSRFELTHDVNMLLPLLVAVTIAHAFTVLVLRSIDPDREGGAPRLPHEPRVRRRSARDPVRARGDARQHRGATGRRPLRRAGDVAARRSREGAAAALPGRQTPTWNSSGS